MISKEFLEKLKTVNLKRSDPSYNFLDVIGKTDNENTVSEWLAFLLDPQKSSSLMPLKFFCEFLDIPFVSDEVVIEREYTLGNRRRIDIIIKFENVWIIIENKINSMECNEQSVDYANYIAGEIQDRNIAVTYVYLKPTYNKSEPKNKNFVSMTYGNLADIWKNIKPDDFAVKANYVYFSEFLKLIKERYAMNNELQFDENTKLYIEFNEYFNAVARSYNNACQIVKEKLTTLLYDVFPVGEGWVISFHSEYIQFYKVDWCAALHFEIGTWDWQKNYKNVSFNRLISDNVEISYCLHAERKQSGDFGATFKDIEKRYGQFFCTENYDFSDEDKCISALNLIVERLRQIKSSIAPIVDNIINAKMIS